MKNRELIEALMRWNPEAEVNVMEYTPRPGVIRAPEPLLFVDGYGGEHNSQLPEQRGPEAIEVLLFIR
jgi:hypothetical protein